MKVNKKCDFPYRSNSIGFLSRNISDGEYQCLVGILARFQQLGWFQGIIRQHFPGRIKGTESKSIPDALGIPKGKYQGNWAISETDCISVCETELHT